jgi:hypothetical protein
MQLHRRWMALAVPAALGALVFGVPAASAPSPAPAAAHVMHAPAAPAPAHGVIHVISNGLAKDCVEIELGNTGLQIRDNGVGSPVTLESAPASCWNLHGPYYVYYGSKRYTGYVYQDLRGDCLWDDDGTITTAAGPTCSGSKNYEVFFGINYYHSGHNGPGWTFTDAYWGPSWYMSTDYDAYPSDDVLMTPSSYTDSHFWNFP